MRTSLGNLNCQIFPEADSGHPTGVVVLCHGFGAPGDDLVPLRDELVRLKPELAQYRFIFPEAPLSLGAYSRAWWMIDFEGLERVMKKDPAALREFRNAEPAGMSQARALLRKLVDEVALQTQLPVSKIVLGGFSQGAMLSTDVALRLEESPQALVIMSGTLLIEPVWRAKAKMRAGLKVLQSHGTQDPLLGFTEAEALRDLLLEEGLKVEWVPFQGAHTIAPIVLHRLAAMLTPPG